MYYAPVMFSIGLQLACFSLGAHLQLSFVEGCTHLNFSLILKNCQCLSCILQCKPYINKLSAIAEGTREARVEFELCVQLYMTTSHVIVLLLLIIVTKIN